MKKFYVLIEKLATLSHQLSWSHYQELIPVKDVDKVNYYISVILKYRLGIRQLREKIKLKEYERLPNDTKNKLINKEDIKISFLIFFFNYYVIILKR